MEKVSLESQKQALNQNLDSLKGEIGEILSRGADPTREVTLIAVTKRHPPEVVRLLLELGHRDLGENYVIKGMEKASALGASLASQARWHLIGPLQKNKIKKALSLYSLIHSVHSVELLESLEKEAQKEGLQSSVLLQVNISGEDTKSGFSPQKVWEAFKIYPSLKGVKIQGLMTLAPFVPAPETRPVFAGLRKLRDEIRREFPEVKELSMGMSNDYPVALEEGATMIRVGSLLFEGIPGNQ